MNEQETIEKYKNNIQDLQNNATILIKRNGELEARIRFYEAQIAEQKAKMEMIHTRLGRLVIQTVDQAKNIILGTNYDLTDQNKMAILQALENLKPLQVSGS